MACDVAGRAEPRKTNNQEKVEKKVAINSKTMVFENHKKVIRKVKAMTLQMVFGQLRCCANQILSGNNVTHCFCKRICAPFKKTIEAGKAFVGKEIHVHAK